MTDFQFLQNPLSKKWVILAPRRAKRPDIAHGMEPECPFCPGREHDDEVFRIPFDTKGTNDWKVLALKNKYPFAPIHEIIIHSPDHHKNFDLLPLEQSELILQSYRNRFIAHASSGQVYIFHNRGAGGGESLPHPHTQLVAIPANVQLEIPRLDGALQKGTEGTKGTQETEGVQEQHETNHFVLFCPPVSQWPDEVWIYPKIRGRVFGEITDEQITDLAFVLNRLIHILDLRHGNEFPFNFYIYPGGDWYLRLIPRQKSLGGFEIGTNIFVNTQDPKEAISFIKEHFENLNEEKIKNEQQANYHRHA